MRRSGTPADRMEFRIGREVRESNRYHIIRRFSSAVYRLETGTPASPGHEAFDPMIEIRTAETDAEILSCFPVMHQLRPHLVEGKFVDRVRRQGEGGYRLAYLADGGEVCAAAGYRFMENLASGKHLYVDDLITDEARRSRGYGDQLLAWLVGQAREAGCAMFELDSGVHRAGAHRFYFRNRMYVAAYHFLLPLDEG